MLAQAPQQCSRVKHPNPCGDFPHKQVFYRPLVPITITPPIDNLFVGPGTQIRVSTDFIGPFPIDSSWQIFITPRTGEGNIANGANYPVTHQAILQPNIFIQEGGSSVVQWPVPLPAPAAPIQQATATIRLMQGNSTVLEQTSTPVQWYPDPAAVAYVQSLERGSASGGFTSIDRSVLNAVLPAVRTLLPAALPGGPQVLMQAIDLVRGPPRSLLRPFGSQLISGRGTLGAQPPGALHSFGGTWQIAVVPAGYGKDDGTVTEWGRRMGQFAVIREGAGDDLYIDVLEDSHRGNDYILWQFPNPTQINYDIAPGVQILWEWLV